MSRREYLGYKELTRRLVYSRLAFFNQHYQLAWRRVAIRDQVSRWGSCSSRKNLNFNYRLGFLPLELVDYVVVHELCHLVEMNHGAGFWALVAEAIPDWRERRLALKGYKFQR
jgi:predicted metal-dependent hydrolase